MLLLSVYHCLKVITTVCFHFVFKIIYSTHYIKILSSYYLNVESIKMVKCFDTSSPCHGDD